MRHHPHPKCVSGPLRAALLTASVAAGAGLLVQGCALSDFEVGTVDGGGEADAAPKRDATVDARVDGGARRDASARHDGGSPDDVQARRDAGARDAHLRDAPADHARPHDAVSPACQSTTYPGPPTSGDVAGEGVYTFAVRTVDLGESEYTPPGYDLDLRDTCCDEAGPTCVSAAQHCDFAGGIDNASAALISQFTTFDSTGFGSAVFNMTAGEGFWSLLIQLSGYGFGPDGGVADDESVNVALFASPGPATMMPPKWDGTDAFRVSASSLGDGGLATPLYRSSLGAYVTNHVLVASLPESEITLAGSSTITIRLSSGVLTGRLEMANGQLQLTHGIIAARWAVADIFQAVASYRTSAGQPLCTSQPGYGTIKAEICQGLDILLNTGDLATMPCAALSMGIGFTTAPILPLNAANISPVIPPPDAGCAPDANPANDSCH